MIGWGEALWWQWGSKKAEWQNDTYPLSAKSVQQNQVKQKFSKYRGIAVFGTPSQAHKLAHSFWTLSVQWIPGQPKV